MPELEGLSRESIDHASGEERRVAGSIGPRIWAVVSVLPVFAVALVGWKYRQGSDSVVRLHDTLDSYYAIFGPLSVGDLFAAPGTSLDLILGGNASRDTLGSELHVGNLLAAGLPLMWAMMLSELIVRCLAFFSMRALLTRIGLGRRDPIVFAVATLFSLLPFYLPAFGAVAALPLVFATFITVFDSRSVNATSKALLLAFPLVANAAYTIPYVFLLGLASIGGGLWLERRAIRPLLESTAWLGLGVVLVDWRIFWSALTGPTSHRAEMFSAKPGGSALWNGFSADLVGEVQHIWLGKSVLMGLVLLGGLLALVARREVLSSRQRRSFAAAMACVLVTTAIARIWPWFEVNVVKEISPDWARFQLGRVRFVEPVLLYVLLALALAAIRGAFAPSRGVTLTSGRPPARVRVVGLLVLVIVVSQGVHLLNRQDFRWNPSSLTPRQYYAQGSMDDIKAALSGTADPLVVSVGLHPAVAVYNGIPSADGYWNQYPLEYKAKFRSLIAPALDANPADASYFDAWGSRAYVFQPELGRPTCCSPPRHGEIELLVNPTALETLGVSHVISSVTFSNASSLGLRLVLETGSEAELGPLYLYERVG